LVKVVPGGVDVVFVDDVFGEGMEPTNNKHHLKSSSQYRNMIRQDLLEKWFMQSLQVYNFNIKRTSLLFLIIK